MTRTLVSFAMAFLLTAAMLWGGCVSCAQYFMLAAPQARHCCTPTGKCDRGRVPTAPAEDCKIQPASVAQTVSSPDHASNVMSSQETLAIDTPPASTCPAHLSVVSGRAAHLLGSPPDFGLLHSVFRI